MLRKLPKPGAWSVWVERLFGFLLLGLALYFVALLLPEKVVPWAIFALALSAGVYLGWLEPSHTGGRAFAWLKKAVGVAFLVLGEAAVVPRTPPAEAIIWHSPDPAVLQQVRKEGP